MRGLIENGQVDDARRILEEHFPSLLQRNSDIDVQLKCQKFINLVKFSHENKEDEVWAF